jgi:hypothetical protein
MKRLAPVLGLALLSGLSACNSGKIGTPGVDMNRGNADLAGFVTPPEQVDLAGFDFPPTLGVVYAHTGTTLYTVDMSTYDLTEVGQFHTQLDLGADEDMTDLAITPDGKVYTISRGSFYSVNETTGRATKIFSGITSSNVAMTFQNNGTLLSADQAGKVYEIDPGASTVTEVGSYGTGYDTAGDLVAIADGTMYGVSTKAPGLSGTTNVLIKVNTSTGKATTVGEIGYTGVFGVAYSGGKVVAFTKDGEIIGIDPSTGQGTLLRTHASVRFYGAGTNPLVPVL